jgi:hypothetical protein
LICTQSMALFIRIKPGYEYALQGRFHVAFLISLLMIN